MFTASRRLPPTDPRAARGRTARLVRRRPLRRRTDRAAHPPRSHRCSGRSTSRPGRWAGWPPRSALAVAGVLLVGGLSIEAARRRTQLVGPAALRRDPAGPALGAAAAPPAGGRAPRQPQPDPPPAPGAGTPAAGVHPGPAEPAALADGAHRPGRGAAGAAPPSRCAATYAGHHAADPRRRRAHLRRRARRDRAAGPGGRPPDACWRRTRSPPASVLVQHLAAPVLLMLRRRRRRRSVSPTPSTRPPTCSPSA